jgi:serine/threonine-protein kinase
MERLKAALADRYTLEKELGRGGMATVYLARDLKHERPVALKVLRPELGAVLGADRFLREIRLTATLQHPHILPLLDSGEAAGQFYYVMPYVEGESLRQRLEREGQLPLDEAFRLTREVAEALDYAHDKGIIHRDIKPENLLLSRGHALVADFGIALAVTQAGGGRLTETGLSLGTPAYMSPEQAMAQPRLDGRTDQYSLASVLYEMLAGEPPYTGSTAQAIIAKRLSEPVPRLGTLRQVPAGLEAAVTRALAKSPADRFPSTGEFTSALERPAGPRGRETKRRVGLPLGAVVMLLLLGAVAWIIRRPAPPEAMVTRQLTFTGDACCPALSPDGNWAAFTSNDSLMVQDLSGTRPLFVARQLSVGDGPRWSPDGSNILYTAEGPDGIWLHTVPRLGGDARRIAKAGWAWFSYSPDGRQVVFSQGITDAISIADVASGEIVRRISLAPRSYMSWRVRFSPDGRWIAFGGAREGIPFLAVISPDGSTMHRLADWVDRGTIEWSPRGDAIYFFQRVPGGADLMKVHVDPKSGKGRGLPVRVMSHAPFYEFSVAADGRTLLLQKESRARHIWTMTITPRSTGAAIEAKPLTSGTASFGNPAISPDGRWVAYARDEARERNIYVVPYDGGTPRRIGPTRSDRVTPSWAPDSRRLAFASADSSTGGVLIADLAEEGVARRGRSPLRLVVATLAWSSDGGKLLLPPDDPGRLVMLDVETNQETSLAPPVTRAMLHNHHFSPDRLHVLLSAGDGYSSTLWLGEVSTGRWQRLSGEDWKGMPVLWSPDGWIYLMRGKELWRVRHGGGAAELYASLPQECLWWEQPSLDQRANRMVCTVQDYESDIWVGTDFDLEGES